MGFGWNDIYVFTLLYFTLARNPCPIVAPPGCLCAGMGDGSAVADSQPDPTGLGLGHGSQQNTHWHCQICMDSESYEQLAEVEQSDHRHAALRAATVLGGVDIKAHAHELLILDCGHLFHKQW